MTAGLERTPKLSVVVAVYNERATIEEILWRVQQVELDKEIIVVDDGSTDGACWTRSDYRKTDSGSKSRYRAGRPRGLARVRSPDLLLRPDVRPGEKITWRDGLKGIWCTVRYGLFSR